MSLDKMTKKVISEASCRFITKNSANNSTPARCNRNLVIYWWSPL